MLKTRSSFDDARYPVSRRISCGAWNDWTGLVKGEEKRLCDARTFAWISPYYGLSLRIFFTCSIEFDWPPDQRPAQRRGGPP